MSSTSSINGMGSVKFPTKGSFGSGDVPQVLSFDMFLKKSDEDDSFQEIDYKDEDNFAYYYESEEVSEKSVMDSFKKSKKNGSKQKQINDHVKKQKEILNIWLKKARDKYVLDMSNAKTPREKKLLTTKYKLEWHQKKQEFDKKVSEYRMVKNRSKDANQAHRKVFKANK